LSAVDLEHVYYAYPPTHSGGLPVEVLSDVSLSIERGEFLSLMGATGSGKTTLCMALNGLVPRSTGGIFRGHVVVLGHDTRETPVATLARQVGIVFQDPDSQFFCASVEDELAFGPENLAVPPVEIAERITWALDLVGMLAARHRAPALLSGGQKQRVAIAAALTLLPEILILDEPTASLDPIGQHDVFAAIRRLAAEREMTIVLASQDAEQVAECSDRVGVLLNGRLARVEEPHVVLSDSELLCAAGLGAPQVTEAALCLRRYLPGSVMPVRLEEGVACFGDPLGARGRADG